MDFNFCHDNRFLPPPAQYRCRFLGHDALPAVQGITRRIIEHSRMGRGGMFDLMPPNEYPNLPRSATVHSLLGICLGTNILLLPIITYFLDFLLMSKEFFL